MEGKEGKKGKKKADIRGYALPVISLGRRRKRTRNVARSVGYGARVLSAIANDDRGWRTIDLERRTIDET